MIPGTPRAFILLCFFPRALWYRSTFSSVDIHDQTGEKRTKFEAFQEVQLLSKVYRSGKLKKIFFPFWFCLKVVGWIMFTFYGSIAEALSSRLMGTGVGITRKAGHLLTSYGYVFSLAVSFPSAEFLGSPKQTHTSLLSVLHEMPEAGSSTSFWVRCGKWA